MTDSGAPITRLGFLTLVPFDPADPAPGLESGIRTIERGESLGYDIAWTRTRHLQFGLPSPAVFLAAAAQRTSRIGLGTAVIPTGFENPFRLAEDLAVADLLSGGRLEPGVSVGAPHHYDEIGEALHGSSRDAQDFGYERVDALLAFLRGEEFADIAGTEGIEQYSNRIEPHSPGLVQRVRYGVGSLRSAEWAGSRGLGILLSNISTGEGTDDFAASQVGQIERYRASLAPGAAPRIAQGRVVLPTDHATPEQRAKYEAYAEARTPRTLAPIGRRRTLIARDLVGPSELIAERLAEDASFREVDEFFLELPFVFDEPDFAQLLEDAAGELAPRLGWSPATS